MGSQTPNIKTSGKVIPMIYSYTTPGVTYHDGYVKVGYTEKDVDTRIREQTHTAGIKPKKEWQGTAIFDDGSGEAFLDKPLHAYMRKLGVQQPQDLGNPYFDEDDKNEWFYTSPGNARQMFIDFKSNRGLVTETGVSAIPYTLRKEQAEAVEKTEQFWKTHPNAEFLWNCKPRFGKTLTVYDFCRRIKAVSVLIVTNRPAIANSWYSDYVKFLGKESGYLFVSETDALKGRPGVISREEYLNIVSTAPDDEISGCIEFVSLQDMKGSRYFSDTAILDKLLEVKKMTWDVLVVDEAHEGVDTFKTNIAFEQIKRKFTLHLSGTPFKAIANSKFPAEAIYNWTYADEQKAKREWDPESKTENPYENLPQINLFTYQMSEIIRDQLQQGIEIQGETEEFAFDLNSFFQTNGNGVFLHNDSVDKFLDALTLQKKFPFSTPELRNELKHTFWLLDRVDSAKSLARKLREHPVFKDYEVILAAGDGKVEDEEETAKSYDKVVKAIHEHDKTITLSVGQLTVGVTIPEWTGVLMLSNIKSPALYMQAAFRAQNPCLFQTGTSCFRKENCYVFDFDPARTLTIYEEFANDLSFSTAGGRGDVASRKENIRTFLNFFPVIGEDENGELIDLDAEQVLTIPRKIKSVEVVRRGFMSNFLFQDISQVFGAPKDVMDIINKMQEAQEGKLVPVNLPKEVVDDLSLDDNGNVSLSDEYVIGKSAEIFGSKIEDVTRRINEAVTQSEDSGKSPEDRKGEIKETIHELTKSTIVSEMQSLYGEDIRPSEAKRLENHINNKADQLLDKEYSNHKIEQNMIDQQRTEEMQKRHETGRSTEEIEREFEEKKKKSEEAFQKDLRGKLENLFDEQRQETIKTVETTIKEKKKQTIEEGVRAHLRGFSRTIPSFLMAYGDDTVTLATFDTKVPGNVFLEVTSITLEEFRRLRDGGKWVDPETGEEKVCGCLFNEVVFDDSVKEFLALKKRLADYFDEKSIEDIFDYIPPQKTNQIYTPKTIVKMMVDKLEEENPGCFDQPDKTFIDLYMKSGLYPAEIVKRLYQSPKMKELFPDGKDRLQHIFEKQVFGLAPTEIIYKIAISFILGFADDVEITKHNFRQADALPYAKEGKLDELLESLYGKGEE